MAWDDSLKDKYKWHRFDDRWDLLSPNQETQLDFLHSLDIFMYQLGHKFTESWGRSTVEAMLTGAIPFVQTGHNFENLIEHGVSGFILDDFQEIRSHVHKIYHDSSLRKQVSLNCAQYARRHLCDREQHRKIWKEALDV
jgi:glycosyltransferase involved in cell wall biosynthesis